MQEELVLGDHVSDGTSIFEVVSLTRVGATITEVRTGPVPTAEGGSGSAATASATGTFHAVRRVKNQVDCTVTDIAPLWPAPWEARYMTATAVAGSQFVTLANSAGPASADANNLAVGDKLLL